MTELFANIHTLVQNNQILSTIAGGSVIIWLVSNLKSILFSFAGFLNKLISFEIENYYEDNTGNGQWSTVDQRVFNRIISTSKALWERTKNIDLSMRNYSEKCAETYSDKFQPASGLAYGFSIRWMYGKLVFCNRSVQKESQKIVVTTNLRVYFGSKTKFIDKLNAEIKSECDRLTNQSIDRTYVEVIAQDRCWNGIKSKRNLTSIFTNNNEHVELYDDIVSFINNKKLYNELNYPWKYSALIYGKPGCGKSSTILAIASELSKDVVYIDLSATSMQNLLDTMNRNRNCIMVFEDIDAVTTTVASNRDNSSGENMAIAYSSNPISLSDILNLTDGLLSSDGIICIFTTNHKEKLDPAFLRAGRMNKTVEFTYLNKATANRMIRRYLGYEIDNLKDEIKPAELQEEILQIKLGKSSKENLIRKFC